MEVGCRWTKSREDKTQLTHLLSIAPMLDQIPFELSDAGVKQGVRTVPIRNVPVRSVPSQRALNFSNLKPGIFVVVELYVLSEASFVFWWQKRVYISSGIRRGHMGLTV